MTFKLNNFNTFQDFPIDFKLILSKFHKSDKLLLKNLQIAAFLYKVKKIYNE